MVTVRCGLGISFAGLVAVLGLLEASVGLGAAGWAAGLMCGLVATVAVARSRAAVLGPADLVTVSRLSLACAVAALVAGSLEPAPAPPALVAIAAVALALDAVDGWVARWSGTASDFGARFDGEADAFLILVLSVAAASTVGGWVLAIGLARYVFGLAGWVLPWMRAQLPSRYWRKVVAATQGIVLIVALAGGVPSGLAYAALLVALALLGESFGRDVLWLWRNRAEKALRATTATPAASVHRP